MQPSPLTENEPAPDTTNPAEVAAFCRRWKLDEAEPGLDAFLDRCRASGTRWADWGAAWRVARREAPAKGPEDDLDTLDLPDLVQVGLAELRMPVVSPLLGLAPATCARVAARAETLCMTMFVVGGRAPDLKAAIRAARKAGTAKPAPMPVAPEQLAKTDSKATTTTAKNGAARRP
jgi:hypothetical protein